MMSSVTDYIISTHERDAEQYMEPVAEKSVSKAQRKFMGMAHAMQKGEKIKGASPELKKVAKTMKPSDTRDFAATKEKDLPKKVKKADEGKGDGDLANNAKPYDKVTRGDVVAGRLGKDAKGGKAVKETAVSGAPTKSGISATAKTTVPGMKATQQDLKKAGASAALGEGKCNHTAKGKTCPVHGLKECGSYTEGKKPDANKDKIPDYAQDGKGAKDLGKGKGAAPKKGVNPFAKK
jgi:hypothetical protein